MYLNSNLLFSISITDLVTYYTSSCMTILCEETKDLVTQSVNMTPVRDGFKKKCI